MTDHFADIDPRSAPRRLDLACGLTEFPREIFELADSLEILNLSGNALTRLPDDLHRLHRLRVLFCSDNRFTELPEALGRCASLSMVGFKANQIRSVPAAALPSALRWLILTDNQIDELPDALGHCTQLQKLMLSGNRLQRLPDTLANCRQLELLRIAANRLTSLPDGLLALPRLAWLACAGNPFSDAGEAAALAAHPMPAIDWAQLQLELQVGEGASGVIHLGRWQRGLAEPLPVAVKLFKGAMTSDGLPRSEMAASGAAGTHPHLIGVHGRIVQHPAGVEGLVMPPVAAAFQNLAGPPSLASCTRDVYAADRRFEAAAALRIALAIASAAAHLHGRGLLHGDVYAHNILWNGQDGVLLGDFGAASFVAPGDEALAQALQRLEVRALACLLEELLARCDSPCTPGSATEAMAALQARCGQEEVGARPLFAEVRDELARWV